MSEFVQGAAEVGSLTRFPPRSLQRILPVPARPRLVRSGWSCPLQPVYCGRVSLVPQAKADSSRGDSLWFRFGYVAIGLPSSLEVTNGPLANLTGGVIFPITLNRLFIEIGFRNTVLTTAGMSAVLFFPAWFIVKARLPPKGPVPWRNARLPWKEGRYTVFVLGVAMIWLNYFTPL